MTNYNLAKIYKIVRNSDDVLIYVGSTCEPMLCRRFDKHKQNAKTSFNRKIYRTVLDNGGWENHQILLIKVYPCDGRDELHSEEARFIRALNPIGNRNIPMRTDKEYRTENKEKIKLKSKTYRIDNKVIINKYAKEYYIDNKEKSSKIITCCCGGTYTYSNRTNHFKTKYHINSIPVQFKLIEEMQNNRKKYIFQLLPIL